jgi:hypothetical protein
MRGSDPFAEWHKNKDALEECKSKWIKIYRMMREKVADDFDEGDSFRESMLLRIDERIRWLSDPFLR